MHKRTEGTFQDHGKTFKVTKGAPQVILQLCHLDKKIRTQAQKAVDELAAKGYRTLGVARADHNNDWQFLGLLPLFDPPRGGFGSNYRRCSGPWHPN